MFKDDCTVMYLPHGPNLYHTGTRVQISLPEPSWITNYKFIRQLHRSRPPGILVYRRRGYYGAFAHVQGQGSASDGREWGWWLYPGMCPLSSCCQAQTPLAGSQHLRPYGGSNRQDHPPKILVGYTEQESDMGHVKGCTGRLHQGLSRLGWRHAEKDISILSTL